MSDCVARVLSNSIRETTNLKDTNNMATFQEVQASVQTVKDHIVNETAQAADLVQNLMDQIKKLQAIIDANPPTNDSDFQALVDELTDVASSVDSIVSPSTVTAAAHVATGSTRNC